MSRTEELKSHGGFETVARSLTASSDLEIVKSLLVAEGIPAFIVDGGINQVNPFLLVATGGVRLQVASAYADEARQILAAWDAGQLALEDDASADSSATPEKRKRRLTAWTALLLKLLGG